MLELDRTLKLLLWLYLTVDTCLTIGINVPGVCDKESFQCQCGPEPGRTVAVTVPQCTFFYKWKPYCHACKNGERISPSDVCPKYQRCAACAQDGESCSVCPTGKFGTFCEQIQTASAGGTKPGLLNLDVSLGLLGGLTGGGKPKPSDQVPPPVSACRCLNGGQCQGFDDFCICPKNYLGTHCERRAGCLPLQPTPPISVVKIPNHQFPEYMEYSCPRTGYLLEGSPRLTCHMESGHWSHPAPTCVPACTAPVPPANVMLVNVSSQTTLIKSGQSVEFRCPEGLVLIGPSKTTCMIDTTWSHPPPYCTKASICPEPLPVVQATYQLQVPPFQPPFSNGTKVVFTCTEGHLLMGQPQIICKDDGQWSSDGPTCVRVYDSEVDCETSGSQVLDVAGTPVRIHCPPNCAVSNGSVWGTVIYEEDSAVCRAAVHAGRISDSLGGSLFVVNNGPYNDFLPSAMNGVTSERKRVLSNSFRFHHDPSLEEQNRDDPDKGCPRGWTELSGHCVYVVPKARAWAAAKGICTNMGSRLPNLRDPQFVKEVLRLTGPQSDVQSFWLVSKSNSSNGPLPLWDQNNTEELTLNPDIVNWLPNEDGEEDLNPRSGHQYTCTMIEGLSGNPVLAPKECTELSTFVCDIDLREFQVTCEDRGEIQNGFSELQDPNRGFRRGAVINFRCRELHVLSGDASSTCLPDGTWSTPLPRCQRIPACLSPPLAKFGSFNILPPLPPVTNSRIAGRPPGQGTRRSRIGASQLPTRRVVRSTQEVTEVPLPPGHLRVGSRASYACESRYYDLVGSQTRRCQADGTWSGRPVTCLPVCGRSDSPRTPFITHGNSSDVGQWPWQVGLAQSLPDSSVHYLLCGGALLNENWVVTAAHCVTDEKTGLPLEPREIQLYAGKYHRDDKRDDDFVQVRKVSEIHVHPDYDPTLYDADIALVRMDSHVTLTSRVQPICLPTDKSTRLNLVDGRKGVVTGWGLTESSEYAESLRHAVLPVVSHEQCEQGYQEAGMPLTVSENMYCAGLEEGNTDACSGDSGGPMVFQMDSGPRKYWVLEGIVSWGSLTGCGNPRQYGGFTKVNQFLDWINEYV